MNKNDKLDDFKTCNKCKLVKSLDNFCNHSCTKDRKYPTCRHCMKAISKENHKNNKYNQRINLKSTQNPEIKFLIKLKNSPKRSKIRYKRLMLLGKRECAKCLLIFKIEDLLNNGRCRTCQNSDRMKSYRKNKAREIKRCKDRLEIDISFRLKSNIRSRINSFIKNNPSLGRPSKIREYLGCSKEYLRDYLQSQFKDGMTWDNYGKWHIDHIIPLSYAKNDEELYKLCHYKNLQPLWARDNISKGGINRN